MKTNYSILVIVNPRYDNVPVITRAKEIATIMKASLHLLVCSDDKKGTDLLNSTTSTLQQEGFQVTSEIAWHSSQHNTIVTVQKAQNSNLVIKAHQRDNVLKKVIVTPEGWKLLRACPCPVLIVKQNKSWVGRPVLVAVDLGSPNKNHIELHNKLVKVANTLTLIGKGSLHLVSVYPAPIFAEIHPDSKLPQLTPQIKDYYLSACKKYEEQYASLSQENIHLCTGSPEFCIPKIATEIDAAVCVIGTVARSGFPGKLIGNTAEVILDDLTCDVLVIKPESISSKVEKFMHRVEL